MTVGIISLIYETCEGGTMVWIFLIGMWGGFILAHTAEHENSILNLMQKVVKEFNFTNCWVCIHAGGNSAYLLPFRPLPLTAYGHVYNESVLHVQHGNANNTWKTYNFTTRNNWYSVVPKLGTWCFQREPRRGETSIPVGTSKCSFTLKWHPTPFWDKGLDCTRYKGLWNSTHLNGMQGLPRTEDECWDAPNYLRMCRYLNSTSLYFDNLQTLQWVMANGTGMNGFKESWFEPGPFCQALAKTLSCQRNDTGPMLCSHKNSGAWYAREWFDSPFSGGWYDPKKDRGPPLSFLNGSRPWDKGPFPKGIKARLGHHFVCGSRAYKELPANWTGTCYVALLLPPISIHRNESNLKIYGPVHQRVARAVKIGGLCGYLHVSECCVLADDNGDTLEQLVRRMKEVAYVGPQTWNGWDWNWMTNWLLNMGWLRSVVMILCVVLFC
ncbi:uncharacterized protein LOC133390193 [Rhineura floridana]|uniref:uncharacterized protein LOC133390193 n=1 Tax=Rhineura floridana TaxID=261503 RepID=UPI002AC87C07|nr:uncharacterized protein LOC133390193 [Rhineura floridana]